MFSKKNRLRVKVRSDSCNMWNDQNQQHQYLEVPAVAVNFTLNPATVSNKKWYTIGFPTWSGDSMTSIEILHLVCLSNTTSHQLVSIAVKFPRSWISSWLRGIFKHHFNTAMMCMSKSPKVAGFQPKLTNMLVKLDHYPPNFEVKYTKMHTKYMSFPHLTYPTPLDMGFCGTWEIPSLINRQSPLFFTGSCDDGAFPAPSSPPERSKKTFHESWWLQLDISCTRDMWCPIPWNTVDGRNPANHLECIKPCK